MLFCLFFSTNIVLAAGPLSIDANVNTKKQVDAFNGSGIGSGFDTSVKAENIVSNIIQVFLSLLSMIFIILVLYAGFNWMTAGGDEQKVTKAKETIYRAVIGLVVTISAFVITYFVFNLLPFDSGSKTEVTPAANP